MPQEARGFHVLSSWGSRLLRMQPASIFIAHTHVLTDLALLGKGWNLCLCVDFFIVLFTHPLDSGGSDTKL